MLAIFDISEWRDDAGVFSCRAMLASDLNGDGIPDPSAPRGYGETVWDAIAALMKDLDGVDPSEVLHMGAEQL